MDLPGHGLASAVDGPYGHLEMAAHVREAMASKGVEQAHYWGTHTGAALGLYLAATETGLLRSLILEGAVVPGDNPPVGVAALGKARTTALQSGKAAAIEQWWREGPWFDNMRANPERCRAHEHLVMVQEFGGRPWTDDLAADPIQNIEGLLTGVTVPALLYNGAADHPDFLAVAAYLMDLLPQAKQATIEYSGGFPAWENPDLTNRLVAEFIAGSDL